jgi:hypothetical protein
VGAGVDNVAGVRLPVFSKYETGAVADNQSLGLVGGGKKIVAVREKFTHLLEMLIKYVRQMHCIGLCCIILYWTTQWTLGRIVSHHPPFHLSFISI